MDVYKELIEVIIKKSKGGGRRGPIRGLELVGGSSKVGVVGDVMYGDVNKE